MKDKLMRLKSWILRYGILVLLGIALIANMFLYWQKEKLSDENQLAQIELSTLKDSVNVYKAKNGSLTFSFNSIQVEKDNLKKALELSGFEISDLKQRDINWRKINFALEAKLEAAGGGTIVLHDSIPVPGDTITVVAKVGKWNDGFLYLNPYLVGNKLDFKYDYRLGMRFLQSKVGKNYVISSYLVSATNPDIRADNVKIVTGNSFTVVPDQKAWLNHWYVYTAAGLVAGIVVAK
jgi:hypothetical protein